MTSEPAPDEAFVWIWLPGAVEPVPAGRIERSGQTYRFNYGQTYLARNGAIPIFAPELPLVRGVQSPVPPLVMANCLRDAAPDAWGRRVIINRLTGLKGDAAYEVDFDELTFLLHSGSDRIGALDFQASPTAYVARDLGTATLEQLQDAAELVQRGDPIPPSLDLALFHGSSIGGARPKALLDDGERKLIAKFSATNDTYAVVKAEFVAMRLAGRVGLAAAPVSITRASGRDVLLIERFDRALAGNGWTRRSMVSALTVLGLDELQARHASYTDLAEAIRAGFDDPAATLRELFGRMVFNILVGNTDDHARNHAAFTGGPRLRLTPAYDICPQGRNNREVNQAMLIHGEDRTSRLATCLAAAAAFLLARAEARAIIDAQVETIRDDWGRTCDEAAMTAADRAFFWRRQFLNDFAFEGYPGGNPLAG